MTHLDWSWVTGAWKGEVEKVGLILLSTPLSKPLLDSLWSSTWPRLVADGGCRNLHAASPDWRPELVLGDLDSAPAELLQWYRERWGPCCVSWTARGVEVRDLSDDQDTTDLEKSLMAAQQVGQ